MNIAIIGASGFIGKKLINELLINSVYNIAAISLDPENIPFDKRYLNRIKFIKANILNYQEIKESLVGIDIAYYLVHMMDKNNEDFYIKEENAALNTGQALMVNNVKRVIYLSGLGNDQEILSKHLSSRHHTGDILRKYVKEVLEFRASMIIGEGSISFEIVKNLVEKSPIITLPKWAMTKTQPIGIDDAIKYLIDAINLPIKKHEIIEIGGKETMSYVQFVKKYVKFRNKKNKVFRVSILPEKIAGLFLRLFNSRKQSNVGRSMLDSFKNEMIVTNERAIILFPDIHPRKIEDFFV